MAFSNKIHFLLLLITFLVYGMGMFVPVMEVDAAQYAGMSIEMLERGNWLWFTDFGKPYLDKPPLIFWTAGLSYRLLGISFFAYKLPSVLVWLLGVYSTFRLAILYYKVETAKTAALVLAISQAGFLMTQDCRTDTLLTGFVVFAVWQIASYLQTQHLKYLIGGSIGVGMAMLAKGPIGLLVPAMAMGTQVLLTREFRYLFKWQWLLSLGIIGLCLSPMLWGLYTQFDLHPETVVNGEKGVSGVLFYFWTQSFGRITGENVWKNDTGFGFLWHTTLWAFLPWGGLVFAALVRRLVAAVRLHTAPEWISLGGMFLPLVALSLSRYKLPHYIFVAYPFGAILVAAYIQEDLLENPSIRMKIWKVLQLLQAILILIVSTLIPFWVFPDGKFQVAALLGIALLSFLYFKYRRNKGFDLLYFPMMALIMGNLLLNLHFYPNLLQYQSGTTAGKWLKEQNISPENVYVWSSERCAMEVPLQHTRNILGEKNLETAAQHPIWMIADSSFLHHTPNRPLKREVVLTLPHYNITALKLAFLNSSTRKQVLQKRFVVKTYVDSVAGRGG